MDQERSEVSDDREVKLSDFHPSVVKKVKEIIEGKPSQNANARENLVFGDYAIINTAGARNRPNAFSHINEVTRFVHINGPHLLWVLRDIKRRAPNLQKVRLIPSAKNRLTTSHLDFFVTNKIEVIYGHHNLSSAWKPDERRVGKEYEEMRRKLQQLDPAKKGYLEELISMGFREAVLMSRYYCLNGEPYISQIQIAKEHGLKNTTVSLMIRSIINLIDISVEVSDQSRAKSEAISRKVEELRGLTSEKEKMDAYLRSLGLECVPEGMPLAFIDTLGRIYTALNTGKFENMKSNQRAYEMLSLRWGFKDGKFRTLKEVGDLFQLTRERVRQIIDQALSEIGVQEEVS